MSELTGFMKTHLVAGHTVYVNKIRNGGKCYGRREAKDMRVLAGVRMMNDLESQQGK